MSDSPILGIPHVAPTQTDKTTTLNAMIDTLEAATQDQMSVDMSAGDVTLSAAQFTRHQFFLVAGLTASQTLSVPNSKRLFVVRNPTAFDVAVKSGTGATVSITAGNGAVLQADGANNTFLFGAGGPGASGSVWREGAGVPANTLGVDGDFYLNGSNGDVSQRAAGTYTVVTNIRGPTGTMPTIGSPQMMGNITGSSAAAVGLSLSGFLDVAAGNARGDILYRSGTSWTVLAPGASGSVLVTQGGTADPAWTPLGSLGAGTVTQIVAGSGLDGGTITTAGTISLTNVNGGQILGNPGTIAATPTSTALTTLLDALYGADQGRILYRGATGWAGLAPGTAGNVLQTGGTAANPSWAAPSGGLWNAGTVIALSGLTDTAGTLTVAYGTSASTAVAGNDARVTTVAMAFPFSGQPLAGQVVHVPVAQAVTLAANFAGTQAYAGIAPTASAAFALAYIRTGTATTIGTVTFAAGAQTATLSTQAAVALLAGDVLRLTAPATQDTTLANVGVTFLFSK